MVSATEGMFLEQKVYMINTRKIIAGKELNTANQNTLSGMRLT
jgi:hypothetical protein